MKITDRIALLKAGYTKEDINTMLEEERQALETEKAETDKEPELNNNYAEVLVTLANEVKTLKETMQATNRDSVDTLAPSHTVDDAMKILEGLINPQAINKEDN